MIIFRTVLLSVTISSGEPILAHFFSMIIKTSPGKNAHLWQRSHLINTFFDILIKSPGTLDCSESRHEAPDSIVLPHSPRRLQQGHCGQEWGEAMVQLEEARGQNQDTKGEVHHRPQTQQHQEPHGVWGAWGGGHWENITSLGICFYSLTGGGIASKAMTAWIKWTMCA